MTINNFILDYIQKLAEIGCDSPRTDTLAILEHVLQKDRTYILAHPEQRFQGATLETAKMLCNMRVKREPLAYILGKKEFYGRDFMVNPDVLIPRPETENLITLALENISAKNLKILDLATGSGIIGVTLKLERLSWQIDLADIDQKALEIAAKNAQNLEADVLIISSDLLQNTDKKYGLIITNLPYVPEGLVTSPEIEKEPKLALFSGDDGLDLYKKFWLEVKSLEKKPKCIITESLESQHMILTGLAQKSDYVLVKTLGLAQLYNLNIK